MKSAFVLSVLCLGLALGPHLSIAQSDTCNEYGFKCFSKDVFQTCVDGGPPSNPQTCKLGSCYDDCPTECTPSSCTKCTTNGFHCVSETTFQECVLNNDVPDPTIQTCPAGLFCDENCNSKKICVEPTARCPVTCEANTRLPVKGKPDSYFVCTVNADKEVALQMYSCAPGTLFDDSKKQCTAGITPTPTTPTTPSTPTTPTTPTTPNTPTTPTTPNTPSTATPPTTVKPFTCIANGRFPNPNDCKKYYVCILKWNGDFILYEYNCPIWSYYNVYTSFCCYDANVCRIGSRPRTLKAASLTSSVCMSDTERFEDPESCNHYYLCSRVGEVLVPHRYSCPKGSVFSPDSGSCTNPENYDCQN